MTRNPSEDHATAASGPHAGPEARAKRVERADEAEVLLSVVKDLVVDFIRKADANAPSLPASNGHTPSSASASVEQNDSSNGNNANAILRPLPPAELQSLLNFHLPTTTQGLPGILTLAQLIQSHSVNTWSQGFLDKLYHSPTPIGIAADLLLSSLNTNVHVFHVSPALTLIEKETTRALAAMFGLRGQWAGGVSQSGGSAANASALVIARNSLFPDTKTEGLGGRKFVIFTSSHGHYSVEKAAQISGFGSDAVRPVAVDEAGRMRPDALEEAVCGARARGETVFFVNATAGTTVLGSFDPLDAIAEICEREGMWMHVDASWGGGVVFSEKWRGRLRGVERADSVAMCPHKMLGVPLTCSVLLGRDLRRFHRAMTLPAGYLFHDEEEEDDDDTKEINGLHVGGHAGAQQDEHDDEQKTNGLHENGDAADAENGMEDGGETQEDLWDLADLTPQCGRRGDILKLALSWVYYGTAGYEAYIDHAFDMASYMTSLLLAKARFSLVSSDPPPCLQVCFYFDKQVGVEAAKRNSRVTALTKAKLVERGFMIDYAPGEEGKFFRVVVNGQTKRETVEALVLAIEDIGSGIVERLDRRRG